MKVTIKSTLADIAPEVFTATDWETAKALIVSHLEETNVKDRDKMLEDVRKLHNLIKIQTYLANSLLKYEGMSLNEKVK